LGNDEASVPLEWHEEGKKKTRGVENDPIGKQMNMSKYL